MRVGSGALTDGMISLEAGEKAARLDSKAETGGKQVDPARQADEPSPFARILHGLGKEMDRGEHLMSDAMHGAGGKELDNGSLLALQAGVYRYSEAVDLSAKLVDRASSGLKTILQGQ